MNLTMKILLQAAPLLLLAALPGITPVPASAQGLSEFAAAAEASAPPPARLAPRVASPGQQTDLRAIQPNVAQASWFAVSRPAPRTYGLHDLVTIVIREDLSTDFSSELETERSSEWDAGVKQFPHFNLGDLLKLRINESAITPDIALDLEAGSEFESEGTYARRDSMSARLTARVVDVKPNGTLVLEARKHLASDDEEITLVATGTCRVDDITLDNTIFSTQLYDLHLTKSHHGELRRGTKKGPLTKLIDALFPF